MKLYLVLILKLIWKQKWMFLALSYCGIMLLEKQQLLTNDLGRHLVNGKLFVETGQIIKTNFYSYSNTNFPVINHHWLSGVFFYLIWSWFGFSGLSIVFMAAMVLALWFLVSSTKLDDGLKALIILLVLPIVTNRPEIRPEMFSYLFLGLFWWTFAKVLDKKISRLWLWLMPLTMILWVNMHIYFLIGWVLGVVLIERLIKKKVISMSLGVVVVGLMSGVMFFNPNGIEGVTYPLSVLSGYGYEITENQPVLEYFKYYKNPFVFHYLGLALVLALCGLWLKKKNKIESWKLGLSGILGIFSWFMVRNVWFMGMLFLIFGGKWIVAVLKDLGVKNKEIKISLIVVLIVIAFVGSGMSKQKYYFPMESRFGLGLDRRANKTLEWIRQYEIEGQIFNNYDVGGFLIYTLYPSHLVYVDNRPEAYPETFFDEYIKLQSDESYWKKRESEFGVIMFAYTDETPWAKPFLSRRLEDPKWEMVYKDELGLVVFERLKSG